MALLTTFGGGTGSPGNEIQSISFGRPQLDAAPLTTTDYMRYIGPSLLEMDEFVVRDALASVTLVQTRAQLRLALLTATLQRLGTHL